MAKVQTKNILLQEEQNDQDLHFMQYRVYLLEKTLYDMTEI